MALMLFIFDGLKKATPSMMLEILYPLIVCIVLAVIGMYIFSFIVGKVLKVSKEMAFAVSLTALYGFPADYIITNEVVKSLTNDEKEKEALLQPYVTTNARWWIYIRNDRFGCFSRSIRRILVKWEGLW